jgi:hypothetical protein
MLQEKVHVCTDCKWCMDRVCEPWCKNPAMTAYVGRGVYCSRIRTGPTCEGFKAHTTMTERVKSVIGL